jgi:hypothetical protein
MAQLSHMTMGDSKPFGLGDLEMARMTVELIKWRIGVVQWRIRKPEGKCIDIRSRNWRAHEEFWERFEVGLSIG